MNNSLHHKHVSLSNKKARQKGARLVRLLVLWKQSGLIPWLGESGDLESWVDLRLGCAHGAGFAKQDTYRRIGLVRETNRTRDNLQALMDYQNEEHKRKQMPPMVEAFERDIRTIEGDAEDELAAFKKGRSPDESLGDKANRCYLAFLKVIPEDTARLALLALAGVDPIVAGGIPADFNEKAPKSLRVLGDDV